MPIEQEATFPDIVSANFHNESTRWATVDCVRKKIPQAIGEDPPEVEFRNYYAILNAEEIANEVVIQNVPGVMIPATINDLVMYVGKMIPATIRDLYRQVGVPNPSKSAKETKVVNRKRKRKRGRKPTMRGVQFTSSPPTIPRASRPSDNFYSSDRHI